MGYFSDVTASETWGYFSDVTASETWGYFSDVTASETWATSVTSRLQRHGLLQ